MKISTIVSAVGLCAVGAQARTLANKEYCCVQINYTSGTVYKYVEWTMRPFPLVNEPLCVGSIQQSSLAPSRGGCGTWTFAASPNCPELQPQIGQVRPSRFCGNHK
ncbi:hypothetical protein E4U42_002562 [Claviceps africana]|uniref:Small secreted protein n=1 Tax=Claviceps africana TaxID=83212 RepID=A0A8K0J8L7_9HYPO|nr:hypothetical protein E4U42_002562 [Claviceps africana]